MVIKLVAFWLLTTLAIAKTPNEHLILTRCHLLDSIHVFADNQALPLERRNIDNEAITPQTWKWIELELTKAGGSKSTIQLRRPNWWIDYNHADKVGNPVQLSMPELGIEGTAFVTKIAPNLLDSRLLRTHTRPDTPTVRLRASSSTPPQKLGTIILKANPKLLVQRQTIRFGR